LGLPMPSTRPPVEIANEAKQTNEENDWTVGANIPSDKRTNLMTQMEKYYERLSALLLQQHQHLRSLEKTHMEMRATRGEIPPDAQQEYDKHKNSFIKLQTNINTCALLSHFV